MGPGGRFSLISSCPNETYSIHFEVAKIMELTANGNETSNYVHEIECHRQYQWITDYNATFEGNRAIMNKYVATFVIVRNECASQTNGTNCFPRYVNVPFNLTTWFFLDDLNRIQLYNNYSDFVYTYPQSTVKWTIDMINFPFYEANGQLKIQIDLRTKTVKQTLVWLFFCFVHVLFSLFLTHHTVFDFLDTQTHNY